MSPEVQEAVVYLKSRRGTHENPATFGYMLAVIGEYLAGHAERGAIASGFYMDTERGPVSLDQYHREQRAGSELPYAFWLGKDGHA